MDPLSANHFATSENETRVDWNSAGLESYPRFLDTLRRWVHLICIGVGCPLNGLVVAVILRQKRLRNPRNTFWLGVILCNLLTLGNGAVEYAAFHCKDETACQIFSLTAGIPYTLLLINMLLATIDRWVALNYPLLHRDSVTVGRVLCLQAVTFVVVITLSTMIFWAGFVAVPSCGVHPLVLEWISIAYASLMMLIIIVQVHIYRKAKSCLRRRSTTTAATVDQAVHRRPESVSRLELEASITLVAGVVSLCFFTLPFTVASTGDWICRHHHGAPAQVDWVCKAFQRSMPYARELFLVHAVYNPVQYMVRSKEFNNAMWSITSETRMQNQQQCV